MADPTGIIDLYFHPALGVLNAQLSPLAPFEGDETLTQPDLTPGRVCYGVVVEVTDIPIELGRVIGWTSSDGVPYGYEWPEGLVQVVVQHQLLSGDYVTTQQEWVNGEVGLVLFDVSLPARVGFHGTPGVVFNVYGLQAL